MGGAGRRVDDRTPASFAGCPHIRLMGETRVNLLRILEDLRDAYPGTIEETILTEVVANSLDSGAREIRIRTDTTAATVTVSDDGKGMGRQALSRYHDLAATTKRRGRTIGFAGVGIKLGLLISEHVVTESRRQRSHRATTWRLSSESRAPWRWIEPPGLQAGTGTTIRLYLRNAFSTLLEPGFIESILTTHFRPVFDSTFEEILAPSYGAGVAVSINGRPIPRHAPEPGRVPITVRVGRQRKASGVGYLLRVDGLADEERGIAVSTLGKVIKRGWDWLGLSPGEAEGVTRPDRGPGTRPRTDAQQGRFHAPRGTGSDLPVVSQGLAGRGRLPTAGIGRLAPSDCRGETKGWDARAGPALGHRRAGR